MGNDLTGGVSPTASVRTLIDDQAKATPQAAYLLSADGQVCLSYHELARGCRSLAQALAGMGLHAGQTVSVVMPNGVQTVQMMLGVMYAGLTVNPVNLLSQPDQMRYVIEHSDCALVCVSPEWHMQVAALLGAMPKPPRLLVVEADGAQWAHSNPSPGVQTVEPAVDAIALLMYTSGTTGVPKGVMLSHGNLVANALSISRAHALGRRDRVLAVLPLYHINAFCVTMLAPIAHGGSLVMPPKFSVGLFWQQVATGGCTWINLVPTMISYLIEGATPAAATLQGIRFCRSASAALAPEHHQAFEQKFGIDIIETMGLTETAAPSFSNPLERQARKQGSVGRASGCEACVIDPQLRPVADGETGEIAIRGPQVMQGYYKNDEATRASFTPDGWLRTGDLGHRDPEGFFFVTGRIKELIIKGGENIAPREIDEALLRHPAVLAAAATGMPDKHFGQQIMACVVLRDNMSCTAAELQVHCERVIGRYKTPKEFHFVKDLPRGPSGKVQRLKLLGWLGSI